MKKTVIITGASRGIGLEIAETLLRNNYNTVLCARKANDEIKKLQEEYSDRVCFISADISKSKDRDIIIEKTKKAFGTVFALINNAGVAPIERKDMLEISEDDFDYVMEINLKGTYFLTQKAVNLLFHSDKGYIINIGSISAESVSVNRAQYCMSKAAERMMTKLFAVHLADKNIGVFEISPGVIDTDMISTVREKYIKLADNGSIPAKRLGVPQDAAKIVMSVLSGNLDYSSGTVIHCDGGLHIPVL